MQQVGDQSHDEEPTRRVGRQLIRSEERSASGMTGLPHEVETLRGSSQLQDGIGDWHLGGGAGALRAVEPVTGTATSVPTTALATKRADR